MVHDFGANIGGLVLFRWREMNRDGRCINVRVHRIKCLYTVYLLLQRMFPRSRRSIYFMNRLNVFIGVLNLSFVFISILIAYPLRFVEQDGIICVVLYSSLQFSCEIGCIFAIQHIPFVDCDICIQSIMSAFDVFVYDNKRCPNHIIASHSLISSGYFKLFAILYMKPI